MKGPMEAMGQQAEMNMSGSTTGKNYYAPSTGLLTKSTTTINISGTMEMAGQNMPVSTKTTTTTELQKL